MRDIILVGIFVAFAATPLLALTCADTASADGDATLEAVHVLCRGQERYVDCKERWLDAYRHGLAAPDPATVVKWWNQGTQCRLQGFDLYDEETGHCIAFEASEFGRDQ